MGTKMFSSEFDYFCPKIGKDLGKFSFVASLICFVSLPSTMLQTFVPMHEQIYILKIIPNFSRFVHRI